MIDTNVLTQAVERLKDSATTLRQTPFGNQHAEDIETIIDAMSMTMNQVSNVVDLLPMQNPELIEAGYSVDAQDILEALNKEM